MSYSVTNARKRLHYAAPPIKQQAAAPHMLPSRRDLFRAAVGSDPDDWQARLLASEQPQLILNCSRQSGKSTVSALLGLHTALSTPGALVILLAPALRQAQELFRKLKLSYAAIRDLAPPLARETALTLEWSQGSRVVCLPGKEATIRGFSAVSLLMVDEAARVPDELYRAVRPMLATSGGRVLLLSTPFGRRGFFYDEWTEGGPRWERVEVKAADVPRIPAAFLAEERRALGLWYAQEYDCQFFDTTNQVFSSALIQQAVSADVAPFEW